MVFNDVIGIQKTEDEYCIVDVSHGDVITDKINGELLSIEKGCAALIRVGSTVENEDGDIVLELPATWNIADFINGTYAAFSGSTLRVLTKGGIVGETAFSQPVIDACFVRKGEFIICHFKTGYSCLPLHRLAGQSANEVDNNKGHIADLKKPIIARDIVQFRRTVVGAFICSDGELHVVDLMAGGLIHGVKMDILNHVSDIILTPDGTLFIGTEAGLIINLSLNLCSHSIIADVKAPIRKMKLSRDGRGYLVVMTSMGVAILNLHPINLQAQIPCVDAYNVVLSSQFIPRIKDEITDELAGINTLNETVWSNSLDLGCKLDRRRPWVNQIKAEKDNLTYLKQVATELMAAKVYNGIYDDALEYPNVNSEQDALAMLDQIAQGKATVSDLPFTRPTLVRTWMINRLQARDMALKAREKADVIAQEATATMHKRNFFTATLASQLISDTGGSPKRARQSLSVRYLGLKSRMRYRLLLGSSLFS